MPVDFLTPAQAQRYGRYAGEPSPAQLARYFHLDDADHALLATRRGDAHRLRMALHLCTVRFLGTFVTDLTLVPVGAVAFVASQLDRADPTAVLQSAGRPATVSAATDAIRHQYGYRDFSAQPEHFRLVRWLYARAWLSAERPSVLFDLATARLVERKVLLPGVSVLARLVARVRDRAAARLWRRLAALPTPAQRTRLEALVVVPDGARSSAFDRLRHAPTRVSASGLVQALDRLTEIRALGVGTLAVSALPPSRVQALARVAGAARAQAIARMPEARRIATLLAFAHTLETTAQDEALDVFDLLMEALLARVQRLGQRERVRTLRELDAAALRLRAACLVVLDTTTADPEVRAAVFARSPQDQLAAAVTVIGTLARPPDTSYYDLLVSRYATIRRFVPHLLATIGFAGADAGRPVLAAVQFLKALEGQKRMALRDAPREIITAAWRRLVLPQGRVIDRRFYTFCVLERLQDGLRRRDVFVAPSTRWGDPRAKLLQGTAWEVVRPQLARTLGHALAPQAELTALGQELDAAYHRTAAGLPTNAAVRIERQGGRDTVVLTGLDKLEGPASLGALRQQVTARLPHVDLPEVLLEVAAWTGFATAFTHVSERRARVADLETSICAVLLAEACNIGLEPLVQPAVPALTRERLLWVQQNYLRADTLTRANARLVAYQATIPLAHQWGGGEVASADGLRFVVPVRTINARPNSKYFGVGKGVTYYNFTSDQFTGFHGIVIPGTLRDSLYILDGLLEQQTVLRPRELMSDTAGYSDLVFGLFWLLGYQFSPRLADLGDTRFWRIDPTATYGPLDGIARQRVHPERIAAHWDDLLRVAGSLKLGTVSASEVIRALGGGSRTSTLAHALGELGRVAKTLYLLAYLDDEPYRRRILTQLNRGESRHSLARAIFYGQRGELRQRYREGQEDQLGALGLVVNAVALWNTRYLDAILGQRRATEEGIAAEDRARLSPLGYEHINLLGRYHFTLAEPVLNGQLRPLRPVTAHERTEAFPDRLERA